MAHSIHSATLHSYAPHSGCTAAEHQGLGYRAGTHLGWGVVVQRRARSRAGQAHGLQRAAGRAKRRPDTLQHALLRCHACRCGRGGAGLGRLSKVRLLRPGWLGLCRFRLRVRALRRSAEASPPGGARRGLQIAAQLRGQPQRRPLGAVASVSHALPEPLGGGAAASRAERRCCCWQRHQAAARGACAAGCYP